MTTDPHHQPAPADPANVGVPVAPRRKSRRGPLLAGAALIAAAAVTAVGFMIAREDSRAGAEAEPTELQRPLEAATAECAHSTTAVRIGDGGTSMVIERVAAEERDGAEIVELVCILEFVDVPDAVISHMDSTRALAGRQDATWDVFTASWTYHPKSGLNVVLQESG